MTSTARSNMMSLPAELSTKRPRICSAYPQPTTEAKQ